MHASLHALLLALLPATDAPPLAAHAVALAAPLERAQDADANDARELIAEYEVALAEYERRLAAVEGAERSELRKNHPAAAFWERFGTHARAGSLHALVWQVENVRKSGLGAKDRREFVPGAFRRLHRDHVTSADYDRVVELAAKHARALGDEELRTLYAETLERNEHVGVLACTRFHYGMHLMKMKERVAGLEQLDICADRYGTTEYGRKAKTEAFVARNLRVGGVAPDFEGRTIDGETFRLSDHRGEVVVLDFFGFW